MTFYNCKREMFRGRNQQVRGGGKERAPRDEYYRSVLQVCMKIT
jgi:hypothetical protein